MADHATVDVQQVLDHRQHPLLSMLRYRYRSIVNLLNGMHRESLLKITVVTVLGTVFWAGLFFLFMFAFKFMNDALPPFMRVKLIERIMSLFFLALIFMLVFSNAVISFSSLFKSTETAFLFSLPIRHDTIFLYKLLESLLFSSWAIFAIGIPLLLAYGIQSGAAWYFYPLVFLFMIPFVLLPAALGTLLGLLLTAIVPRQRGIILGMLAMALLVIASYIAVTIMNVQRNKTGNPDTDASVQLVLNHLAFTRQPMTPNFWMTEGVLAIGAGLTATSHGSPNWVHAGAFFGALTTSALFFIVLGWFLSGSIYESTYSYASAGGEIRRITRRTAVEFLFSPLLNRYPETMILLVKDIKTFARDPAQWSQVLIFFGILTLYIGNLRNFSYPLHDTFYQNLISFLNLGATCMTLATMTSRFIFPLISLEGARFWVLGLVPISRRDIMMSKFYYAFAGSLILTISLVWLSNYILQSPNRVFWIQIGTAALISLGLSGLSVGMGALFPSFNERNPSKIVSGFGGTLTLILAIGLVIISILGEGLVCHRFLMNPLGEGGGFEQRYNWIFVTVMLSIAALNIGAAYFPMKYGIRALEKVEF
jgi:ABC-2 type transport system permease protein